MRLDGAKASRAWPASIYRIPLCGDELTAAVADVGRYYYVSRRNDLSSHLLPLTSKVDT